MHSTHSTTWFCDNVVSLFALNISLNSKMNLFDFYSILCVFIGFYLWFGHQNVSFLISNVSVIISTVITDFYLFILSNMTVFVLFILTYWFYSVFSLFRNTEAGVVVFECFQRSMCTDFRRFYFVLFVCLCVAISWCNAVMSGLYVNDVSRRRALSELFFSIYFVFYRLFLIFLVCF